MAETEVAERAIDRLRRANAKRKASGTPIIFDEDQNQTPEKPPKQITYQDFYNIAGVRQHSEFEKHLKEIVFIREKREAFYDGMNAVVPDLAVDSFKPYFELYAAERKSFQQDYTPDELTALLATLTRSDVDAYAKSQYSGYDATAGTGGLIIQKWQDDRIQETPWSYARHECDRCPRRCADRASQASVFYPK